MAAELHSNTTTTTTTTTTSTSGTGTGTGSGSGSSLRCLLDVAVPLLQMVIGEGGDAKDGRGGHGKVSVPEEIAML